MPRSLLCPFSQPMFRCVILFSSLLAALLVSWTGAGAQDRYDPAQVYQRSVELKSAFTVLTIALEPGFEDFDALDYLWRERGAKLVTLYVTSGESGPNDDGLQIPGEIAFHRREEAFLTMRSLGGYELFLNMPDFGSSADTAEVRLWWPADSLRRQLTEMIQTTRPDLILLPADLKNRTGPSARWVVLKEDLESAVRMASVQARGIGALPAWDVNAVFVDEGDGQGLSFPEQSESEIGPGRAYQSLRFQLPAWREGRTITYDRIRGPGGSRVKQPDDNLPLPPPARLSWVADEVRKLVSSIQKKTDGGRSSASSLVFEQHWVVAVMDSVDRLIAGQERLSNRERKILLQWKEGLEELRSTMFGVEITYQFRDSVLLARQVTSMTVEAVKGVPSGGTTEIFFPDIGRRWIPGVSTEQRQELELGKAYEFISPTEVDWDLPVTYGWRGRVSYGTPFTFFVFHTGQTRAENFFKKITVRYLFAPKLTVEPVTPIVRVVPEERVVARLTNHSHDGLRDSFSVSDSVGSSEVDSIRLRGKESVLIDTLNLSWSPSLEEGDYRVPISIGGHIVTYFGARKFGVATDADRSVAIAATFPNSPAVETLRRLGVQARLLPEGFSLAELQDIDVLVLDERLLSIRPSIRTHWPAIERFAEEGGRVVILAQGAQSWNEQPLLPGLRLEESTMFSASSPVRTDSTTGSLHSPNPLSGEDWEGWLFQRSSSRMQVSTPALTVLVADEKSGSPLVVSARRGDGTMLHTSLSLASQLMNVHPGAYRIYANLLWGN